MSDVTIKDNSKQFIEEMKGKVAVALEAIGLQAEGYAKMLAPVDTGNLRNSISHAVYEDSVYIGTNVEYAVYQEMGTRNTKAQPYLRPAVVNHINEYKEIAESYMKSK